MLFGLFGWRVAGLYVASGLIIASLAGFVIGRFKLERYVEDFVWKMQATGGSLEDHLNWNDRLARGWDLVKEIVGKVWLYVIIGIGVGQLIHGYVPGKRPGGHHGQTRLVVGSGRGAAGRPAVLQCAGVIPIVSALMEKALHWARCWRL